MSRNDEKKLLQQCEKNNLHIKIENMGRHLEFDISKAKNAATQLFWSKGYQPNHKLFVWDSSIKFLLKAC